jgi:hypothetical protein
MVRNGVPCESWLRTDFDHPGVDRDGGFCV